ncbi:hypothetical protein P9112_003451 [Eukaryota sp. TZLM1-RC]
MSESPLLSFPPPPPFFQLYDKPDALSPPSVPQNYESSFELYGETFSFNLDRPSLKEQGSVQLFPDDLVDIKSELKRLNHSLVFNYCELLRVLTRNPSQNLGKITQMENIMLNMRFLLEKLREDEALFNLKDRMKQSISEITQVIEELKNCKSNVEEIY